MKILRTPDEQFGNLPDFPWQPHYMTVRDEDGTDIRIHCIDEGPRDAPPVLLIRLLLATSTTRVARSTKPSLPWFHRLYTHGDDVSNTYQHVHYYDH